MSPPSLDIYTRLTSELDVRQFAIKFEKETPEHFILVRLTEHEGVRIRIPTTPKEGEACLVSSKGAVTYYGKDKRSMKFSLVQQQMTDQFEKAVLGIIEGVRDEKLHYSYQRLKWDSPGNGKA